MSPSKRAVAAGLDQLQGAHRAEHRSRLGVGRQAAGSSPTPPGECWAQSFATAEDKLAQRVHGGDELWVDLRGLIALCLEEGGQLAVHFGAEVVIERMNLPVLR
jgi:hypothetical protein